MNSDPRHGRSAQSLAAAVFAAAAAAPIGSVTVAQLSRDAGVSRATFYNHASSPVELLVRALSAELDIVRTEFLKRSASESTPLRDIWRASERHLLAHIESHDGIYQHGMRDALGEMLSAHIQASLEEFAHRDNPSATENDRLRSRMAASFVAQGSVGAIARWLESPAPRDVECALDVLMESIPEPWLETIPAGDPRIL